MTALRTGQRRSDGERTHAAILEAATRVASVEGIEGLSIGRLAAALGVSKSGLYAHFGSKEQLQLETIEAARRVIEREVLHPAFVVTAGFARLEALCDAYLSYVARLVFPGGCFMSSLLAEMDGRSGPIHDLAVVLEGDWMEGIVQLVRDGQRLGEIRADMDTEQLAFELDACLELTNYHFVLFRDPAIIDRGRRAVEGILVRSQANPH